MSNFSFSNRFVQQTHKNKGLFGRRVKVFTNYKFIALSKLKAFEEDNFSVIGMVEFFFDMVENIVEKGENAGYQYFFFFTECFPKASFPGSLKVSLLQG